MIQIPIAAIPNQSLSIQLDQNNFDIRIHDCGNIMAVDIAINNEVIVTGVRATGGFPLLEYSYLEDNGNLTIITENDEYPDWRRFGIDQFLIYATAAELEALRADTSS